MHYIPYFSFFKMPFHSENKTIPSEISMSGDDLRLKNLPSPWEFDQWNLPSGRESDQKICLGGQDLTGIRKFALGLPGG